MISLFHCFKFFLFYIILLCVCVHTWRLEDSSGSWFSPILWVLEAELRLSDLMARAFLCFLFFYTLLPFQAKNHVVIKTYQIK